MGDGEGALGRALVDSVLAAATPGTAAYAEALYWRAVLAEGGADAERDYRQLAVEYGFSPRSADALVALAQLALARGQPAGAREPLDRLLRDYRDLASQARGHYWLARAHLDAGDSRAACVALDAAEGAAGPGSEVARQVASLRASGAGVECQPSAVAGRQGLRDSSSVIAPTTATPPPTPDPRPPIAESRRPTPELRPPPRLPAGSPCKSRRTPHAQERTSWRRGSRATGSRRG